MDKNKRNSIKLLGTVILSSLTSYKIMAGDISMGSKNSDEHYALLNKMRNIWLSTESLSPEEYIGTVRSKNSRLSNKEIINTDFKNENIKIMDGLVLSKFEAAHLAALIDHVEVA